MTSEICIVKGVFNGLYEWGSGWSKETAQKWNEYWHTTKLGYGWQYIDGDTPWSSGCLVNDTAGSIYLHPMNFHTVFHSAGGSCPRGNNNPLEDYFGDLLDKLKKLCDGAAEVCGGTFDLRAVYKEIEIPNGEMVVWK